MESRSHETRILIDAPLDEVWAALVDPARIIRWFSPHAEVEPRLGGTVLIDWGGGLDWRHVIEVWEPNRHLRLTETRDRVLGGDSARMEARRLAQDFFLEGEGGSTVLRLVHSGFGSGQDWDREYEGTRGGWTCMFFALKHMLERHRHSPCYTFSVSRMARNMDRAAAEAVLEAALPQPNEIVTVQPLQKLSLLREWNDSVASRSYAPQAQGTHVWTQFLLFGLTPGRAAEIERSWIARMDRLFA